MFHLACMLADNMHFRVKYVALRFGNALCSRRRLCLDVDFELADDAWLGQRRVWAGSCTLDSWFLSVVLRVAVDLCLGLVSYLSTD